MKIMVFLLIIGLLQAACASMSPKSIMQKRFNKLTDQSQAKEKRYQGILVGIVTPFETKVISFGDTANLNEKTIFEIGSITKGFVGLALAQASIDGKLKMDSAYSDAVGLDLPKVGDKDITWTQLANHTSGLPRIPDNMKPKDPLQPYLDYDKSMLELFVASYKPKYPAGTQHEYSNTGAGVVGMGLEKIHRKSLAEILQQTITVPLKMDDTQIFLNKEQDSRVTSVFLNGDQVPYWHWNKDSALQGAGALKSSMTDMLKFLMVMMGVEGQSLLPSVKLATQTTWTKGHSSVGLFWNRLNRENIVWHNGGTYGSSSFIGFDPDKLVGLVVLANTQIIDEKGVDSRLYTAAINTLIELRDSLSVDRPLQVLLDYDSDIKSRIDAFNKRPVDLKNKDWVKSKLQHMVDMDQTLRSLVNKPVEMGMTDQEKKFYQQAYGQRFYIMDWQNTQDMKKLFAQHGWFKVSQWGKQADNQAWLLVQHADHDPIFQKSVLRTLSKLYKSNETSPSNYAYLWDRVASSFNDPTKRKPQRYGTQGQCVGPGQWEPLPIEDEKNVDKRRKEVGLPTLEDYKKNFKDICK